MVLTPDRSLVDEFTKCRRLCAFVSMIQREIPLIWSGINESRCMHGIQAVDLFTIRLPSGMINERNSRIEQDNVQLNRD